MKEIGVADGRRVPSFIFLIVLFLLELPYLLVAFDLFVWADSVEERCEDISLWRLIKITSEDTCCCAATLLRMRVHSSLMLREQNGHHGGMGAVI